MSFITPYRGAQVNPYTPAYNEVYPVEYFSGVDVSLFLAGNYIDEICEFQCALTENQYPIYSYASYTANRIIPGTRIVQGSFCINLRPGDYLHELVNSINDQEAAPLASQTLQPNPYAPTAMPDPQTDPTGYQQWIQNQKNINWGNLETIINQGQTDLSRVPYFTNTNFQILLVYGDIDSIDITARNSGRVRTIEGVSLMSVGQRIDLSGENIQEMFQFIATDINAPNRSIVSL
jgi:hypothetical protein